MALELVKEASFYSCIRHIYNRMNYWNEATPYLEKILFDLKETDVKKGVDLLNGIQKTQKSFEDWHTFSAAIDTEIVPRILEYLRKYTGINVKDGEWILESAQTGFLTLKSDKSGYLHSPADPMWESFLYAYSVFDPEAKNYYILGGGLGYLAYQLWRMSSGDANIYIFEIDKELTEYAELYGVLSFIPEDKLQVITGDDTDIILEQYTRDVPEGKTVRTIYHWDLSKYKGEYADYFKVQLSNEITGRAVEHKWRRNYDSNIQLEHKTLSELDTESFKEEWVIVGAGPSLNDNADFIVDSVGKRTICAINASLKWFSRNNIIPDVCTALDPHDSLVPHIEGIEDFSKNVPLVMDCVTNRRYAEMYKGPRYYIYSTATALTIGRENVIGDIWEIGGTVTSMAIDLAYRMGAKKIYVIGADLAYPDGVTYANGVGHDTGKWIEVEETLISVDDKIIPTSIKFNEYKGMIEDQIAGYHGVEVINKSLHGAYLNGTFCNQWWENLPNSSVAEDYLAYFINLKRDSFILGWKRKYYIFWQLIARMNSLGIKLNSEDENIIQEAYMHIYELFKKELNWTKDFSNKRIKGQSYIFTSEYVDDKDSHSKEVLDIVESETDKKQKVLIVNTGESLGGEPVTLHNPIPSRYNKGLETTDKIYKGGRSFSYFQFPDGMPDISYYRAFLDSVSDSIPEKIICSSKYSLLADYCFEKFDASIGN